ncbi:MAG: 2-keto-4-pentenoate hydratase [Steroidobacteraceae bacterium]
MGAAANQNRAAGETAAIVERFVAARLQGRSLPEYPGAVPADLATAYACQEAAIERWPERVRGWKVARIAPAQQAQYPEERLIGPAFEPNIHSPRAGEIVDCPVFDGGFAAVEAELVVVVGRDAPPDKTQWSIDEASELVGSLHIGIEVASSPLRTLNDLGAGAVISDFGNNWGIVIGPAIARWQSLHEVVALSFIGDEFVGRGTTSLRQGPLGALAFTLGKCARRGRPLRSGDAITTGMITGVHDIRAGQKSRHVFEGFGEVGCRAVRAVARQSHAPGDGRN